jgi:hypothetical protein
MATERPTDPRDEANAARHAEAARVANEEGRHPTAQARPTTARVPLPDAPRVLALRSAVNDLTDARALDDPVPQGEPAPTVAVTFSEQYLSYFPGESAHFSPAQAARLAELGVVGGDGGAAPAKPPPSSRDPAKETEQPRGRHSHG